MIFWILGAIFLVLSSTIPEQPGETSKSLGLSGQMLFTGLAFLALAII